MNARAEYSAHGVFMAFHATQAVTFEVSMSFLRLSFSFHMRLGCCSLRILLNCSHSVSLVQLHPVTRSFLHFSCQLGIILVLLPQIPSFFFLPLHTFFSLRPQYTSRVSDPIVSKYIIPHTLSLQNTLYSHLLYYRHYGEHRFRLCYVRAHQLLHVQCRLRLRQFSKGERPSRGADSGM